MRRGTLAFLFFCINATYVCAQGGELLVWHKPDLSRPPFGVMLKRAVVNIEESCRQGNSVIREEGTGFFVSYGDPRLPQGQSFAYLVSNRHVAQCWDGNLHPLEIVAQKIRVNKKGGGAELLDLNPSGWLFPGDLSVDLAAMSVGLPDDLDVDMIPMDLFATKAYMHDNAIAEGSQVVLSGYFYQLSGNQRFEPIVRQGILSMIPDELVTTTTGRLGSVYLCDAHIFGGNSGSPVMVASDSLNMAGYHLLGVVSGYYFEDENFNLEIATTIRGTAKANSGIAMVVPADLLKTLLDDPRFSGSREAYISQLPRAQSAPSDQKK